MIDRRTVAVLLVAIAISAPIIVASIRQGVNDRNRHHREREWRE